eukprot:gene1108-1207_t
MEAGPQVRDEWMERQQKEQDFEEARQRADGVNDQELWTVMQDLDQKWEEKQSGPDVRNP